MPDLHLIPKAELDRDPRTARPYPRDDRLALLADMCRLNALVAVKRAGSGHLGSSFSALDIVAYLLFEELNIAEVGWDASGSRRLLLVEGARRAGPLRGALRARGDPARTTPAAAASRRARRPSGRRRPRHRGELRLARHGHLEGTRDRLGEAAARPGRTRRRHGRRRRAAGGAELRGAAGGSSTTASGVSGSSSTATSSSRTSRRRRSSRSATSRTSSGRSAGTVRSCDGHDHAALRATFSEFREGADRPKVLVAHTIKGKAVSFMEHPVALRDGGGTYRWHAGAPDDETFARAFDELVTRIDAQLAALGLDPRRSRSGRRRRPPGATASRASPSRARACRTSVTDEYVVEAYGKALLELGAENDDLVVLDADLASDCRVRVVRARVPGPVRRVRDRRAGHGLDRGGPRAARPAARRQLVRLLPRVARERADLQPGERGDEGRLRPPLRGPHPRRAREVAPVAPRHLAARRRSPA